MCFFARARFNAVIYRIEYTWAMYMLSKTNVGESTRGSSLWVSHLIKSSLLTFVSDIHRACARGSECHFGVDDAEGKMCKLSPGRFILRPRVETKNVE